MRTGIILIVIALFLFIILIFKLDKAYNANSKVILNEGDSIRSEFLINGDKRNFLYHKDLDNGYVIIVLDSCEYIYAWFGGGYGGGTLTHKGNCKFCKERL